MSNDKRPVTILVVDDDALITLNTVDLIEELGYVALEAYSGAEALQILAERPDISAMMTDYSMPNMSGAELADAAHQIRPDLPIILVTGYAELPNNCECALPRLEKPYTLDQLNEKLVALIA